MSGTARFIFVSCQRGAEAALKTELARKHPDYRFAFSRPGFITFKLPAEVSEPEDVLLESIFARTYGISLGRVEGESGEALADQLWEQIGQRRFDQIHVWERDRAIPGDGDFEPGITPLADEIGELLANRSPTTVASSEPTTKQVIEVDSAVRSTSPPDEIASEEREKPSVATPLRVNQIARSGELILDCVLVEPNQWWFGCHRAASPPSRWPGGICPTSEPENMISRAYLKMEEALRWSQLPIHAGDLFVEIGSAPGGACQALLERGLQVAGIDPAEMDPLVLEHPSFTHVKKRAADLKRREFRGVKWLAVDSNVAPNYSLDSVEAIVTNRQTNIRGMILTLKLLNWGLAEQIEEYFDKLRSWGFQYVRARQLSFNRKEFCVVAMRSRAMRRPPRKKSPTKSPNTTE